MKKVNVANNKQKRRGSAPSEACEHLPILEIGHWSATTKGEDTQAQGRSLNDMNMDMSDPNGKLTDELINL